MAYSYSTTSQSPTGNHFASSCRVTGVSDGFGFGPSLFREQQSSPISWIVGSKDSVHFVSVDQQGIVQRFGFDGVETNATLTQTWTTTRPLVASGNPLRPVKQPDSASPYTQVVPTPTDDDDDDDDDGLLFVDATQVLQHSILVDAVNGSTRLLIDVDSSSIVDPLPDAHIVYSETNEFWALYSHASSDRYVHGILGDQLEGFHLHILNYDNQTGSLSVANDISIDMDDNDNDNNNDNNDMVFEGLGPMWADIDGDGTDDLLTTIATSGRGAALRVYFLNPDATIREQAESDFIGRGGRWLHQLAVGPLGPNGETEIVEVRTPHIGGIIRYYRYDATQGKLVHVAATGADTYTTHEIGSRNLDQAIVDDLNGDGVPELVVQNQARTALHGLQRMSGVGGVERAWSFPIVSPIYSNIAASCVNGTSHIVFGTYDANLYHIVFTADSSRVESSSSSSSSSGSRFAMFIPTPQGQFPLGMHTPSLPSMSPQSRIFLPLPPMWLFAMTFVLLQLLRA